MATVNFRVDDALKNQAYEVLRLHGVTPTELFTNALRYIADTGTLPIKSVLMTDDDEQLLKIAQKRSQDSQENFREITLDDL